MRHHDPGRDAHAREAGVCTWSDLVTRATVTSSEVARVAVDEFGVDPEESLDGGRAVDNACFTAAPRRGQLRDPTRAAATTAATWLRFGRAYDAIARRLFAELRVDRFLLEYGRTSAPDASRPLRSYRAASSCARLVARSSVRGRVRRPAPRRIDEARPLRPLAGSIALSQQCGFASTMEGNWSRGRSVGQAVARRRTTSRGVGPS